ncbi:MAG: hypothetical protein ABIL09_06670 [Gemmatimonadota bacterium]
MTLRMSNLSRTALVAGILGGLVLSGCGGGTGLGPSEIKQREERLRDRLPIDWSDYRTGDYAAAIESFTQTLEQADVVEGVEGVKTLVKAEAQNGIGWAYLRLQDLPAAAQAFTLSTRLDRNNPDAWVGWAGVALALRQYADVLQYANQALELEADYNSGARLDPGNRILSHDTLDERHVRLMLAEAYFQLGRYSAADRPDPNNAAAQLRLIKNDYRYKDPGELLETMSQVAIQLQSTITAGN